LNRNVAALNWWTRTWRHWHVCSRARHRVFTGTPCQHAAAHQPHPPLDFTPRWPTLSWPVWTWVLV